MPFVNLVRSSDGATVAVQNFSVLSIVPVDAANCQIALSKGADVPAPPTYITVQGTVAAIVAALGGTAPTFGENFAQGAYGPFDTNNPVPQPTGEVLAAPADGTYWCTFTGTIILRASGVGAQWETWAAGAPIGGPIILPPQPGAAVDTEIPVSRTFRVTLFAGQQIETRIGRNGGLPADLVGVLNGQWALWTCP